MFKQLKSLAGKKGKAKSSGGTVDTDDDEEVYRDVKEKDLPKLLLAVWQGDLTQAAKCLKKKPTAGDALYKGRSALHLAASAGHSDVVEYLCHQCPDIINGQDTSGATPLIRAVRSGSGACVAKLLESDCDVTIADCSGATALHRCAQLNDEGMAGVLVEHGSSLDATDKTGNTPLHVAVMAGSMETCGLLLSRGCSPDILNDNSMTPLMMAASDNRVMLVRNALLKHPCNVLLKNKDGLNASELAIINGHHGLNDLIAQHENTRSPPQHVASLRSPGHGSENDALSGGSASGPPPLRTVRTGVPTARNPSTDDIEISEVHDDTVSQASENLNSWGSGGSDSEIEETFTKDLAPQTSRSSSVRQPQQGVGPAGRLSPWTSLSPPAAQGDGSESSDNGAAAVAPVRQSRTRIPSSVTSSRPHSPGVEQTGSPSQVESRIPRPQAGGALPRRTSTGSLQSGSKIPVLSPKNRSPAREPASPPTSATQPLQKMADGKMAADVVDGDAGGAGNEDDEWDTESTISEAGDDVARSTIGVTGDAAAPAFASPRHADVVGALPKRDDLPAGGDKAAGPVSLDTRPRPAMTQPVAPEMESDSDFSLGEDEEDDHDENAGEADRGANRMAADGFNSDKAISRPSVQRQSTAADLGLDDVSFGSDPPSFDASSSFSLHDELNPTNIGGTNTLQTPGREEPRRAELPVQQISVEPRGRSPSKDSSDFSFQETPEETPTRVDASGGFAPEKTVTPGKQIPEKRVLDEDPVVDSEASWDSEDEDLATPQDAGSEELAGVGLEGIDQPESPLGSGSSFDMSPPAHQHPAKVQAARQATSPPATSAFGRMQDEQLDSSSDFSFQEEGDEEHPGPVQVQHEQSLGLSGVSFDKTSLMDGSSYFGDMSLPGESPVQDRFGKPTTTSEKLAPISQQRSLPPLAGSTSAGRIEDSMVDAEDSPRRSPGQGLQPGSPHDVPDGGSAQASPARVASGSKGVFAGISDDDSDFSIDESDDGDEMEEDVAMTAVDSKRDLQPLELPFSSPAPAPVQHTQSPAVTRSQRSASLSDESDVSLGDSNPELKETFMLDDQDDDDDDDDDVQGVSKDAVGSPRHAGIQDSGNPLNQSVPDHSSSSDFSFEDSDTGQQGTSPDPGPAVQSRSGMPPALPELSQPLPDLAGSSALTESAAAKRLQSPVLFPPSPARLSGVTSAKARLQEKEATEWSDAMEESTRAREEAQSRRAEQERLAKEAEERALLRQQELEHLAKEEEDRRAEEKQRCAEEERQVEERRQQQLLLEREAQAKQRIAAEELRRQEVARAKQEREARSVAENQERLRHEQEVAAIHQIKMQESVEEERSLARRQSSILLSPRSDRATRSGAGTPVLSPQHRTDSDQVFSPDIRGARSPLLADGEDSRPSSSLEPRVPRAAISPAGSEHGSEHSHFKRDESSGEGAVREGADQQDAVGNLTGSSADILLDAMTSGSQSSFPMAASTPIRRIPSRLQRQDTSSSTLEPGDDAGEVPRHMEAIRDLHRQLEQVKLQQAMSSTECEQLRAKLTEAKQLADENVRLKSSAEHARMDSELKLRNITYQYQQECQTRETSETLVKQLRDHTDYLEQKMTNDTEARHSAEGRCRQLELEKGVLQTCLDQVESNLCTSREEVNQERTSKDLLNDLLEQHKAYQGTLQEEATRVSLSKAEQASAMEAVSKECRELKDKLAVQQSQLELAQAELAVAQRHSEERATTQEMDLEELRGELQERNEALGLAEHALSQDKLSHQLQLQGVESQLQQVTVQLDSARAEVKTHQDEIRAVEVQLAERNGQLSSSTKEREMREQSSKDVELQLRSKVESHDRAVAELAAAKERLSSVEAEVSLLRSQVQATNEKLGERERAGSEAQQRFSEVLNSCRSDAERAKHDADSRQEHTYEQLIATKEQLTRSENAVQKLQHEVASVNKDYRQLSEKDVQLDTLLQEKTRQLTDAGERLSHQSEKISEISEQLRTLQHELAASGERESRLAEQLDAVERANTEVGERLQMTTRDALGVATTKNDLEQELSRQSQHSATQTLELRGLQKKYDEMTGEAMKTKEAYVRLEARVSQLKSENLFYSQKLKEETSLRSVAEHDSEETKALWESEVRSRSQLGAQMLSIEKKEAEFKMALEQEKRKTLKALHMKRDADNRAATIDEKCTELEQLVNKYLADYKACKRRLKDVQASQLSVPKIQADIEAERSRYQEQVRSLQEKLGQSTQHIQADEARQLENRKQRARLREELKQARMELDNFRQREEMIKSTLGSLEGSKRAVERELADVKSQLGSKWVEAAEMDSFKRKVELESRVELNRRLGAVNTHLQEQASTRTALEQLQAATASKAQSDQGGKITVLKRELEETTAELQDSRLEMELALADGQKYKKLYEAEMRHSQSLSTRLLKSSRADKHSTRTARLSHAQQAGFDGEYGSTMTAGMLGSSQSRHRAPAAPHPMDSVLGPPSTVGKKW